MFLCSAHVSVASLLRDCNAPYMLAHWCLKGIETQRNAAGLSGPLLGIAIKVWACSLQGLKHMASKWSFFMCRVRAEFQSYTITFGKVADASETSAPTGNDRAIEILQDIAEQHPDIADAARYGCVTRCHVCIDISILIVNVSAPLQLCWELLDNGSQCPASTHCAELSSTSVYTMLWSVVRGPQCLSLACRSDESFQGNDPRQRQVARAAQCDQ